MTHRTDKARHFADKKTLELAASEERWNLALKGAEIGVFDTDLVKESSIVSDTWKDLMNVPLDDPSFDRQEVFLKRIHPDDLALVQAADKACFEGKADRSVAEFRIQTSPGLWRWIKSDAAVVERTKEGKALRFVGSQTDVTSLHVARKTLQASREQFETLFSRAPVGMALIDEKATITSVNSAFCSFLGCSATDLISKKYWNFMLPDESRKAAYIIEAIRNGDQVTHQSEYQFVAKDGQIKWGLANVSLDRDTMMGRDRYIVQIQDINNIKEIEKIKSEFIATVSHELRTPLTSIKGAVELIHGTERGQLSGNAVRLLDIAKSNCGRLTLLVNDILDMEKISSGDFKINFTGENLKLLIQNSIKNIASYLIEHKLSVICKMPQDDPIVWVDGKRVEQILTNLLSNAAKFSYSGGDIQVSFKLEDQFVKVIVCDFGIGISKEFKSQIFEPFTQADSSATRKKEGTGLGLHITKQLVEQMGGDIGVESIEDSHTIFWFTLPLKSDQPI